jgi:glycosyltransferase involved in cell wall biosynthesis
MACGVPFIGCGIGEIVRLSENSKAGILTENDPESIAEVIIDLLENPKKREEMSKNGIEHAREYYDRENIALKIKEYIGKI